MDCPLGRVGLWGEGGRGGAAIRGLWGLCGWVVDFSIVCAVLHQFLKKGRILTLRPQQSNSCGFASLRVMEWRERQRERDGVVALTHLIFVDLRNLCQYIHS